MPLTLPRAETFTSPLHHERTATMLGLALGVAFGICAVTGLLSHSITHPVTGLEWPAGPRDLYRVITATHTVTGFASLPLLVAKLWVVHPKLWRRPAVRGPAHLVERLSLVPLVGGSLYLAVTGIEHVLYAWPNAATVVPTHYAAAWITAGGLVVHVVAKRASTSAFLRGRRDSRVTAPPPSGTVAPPDDGAPPGTAGPTDVVPPPRAGSSTR